MAALQGAWRAANSDAYGVQTDTALIWGTGANKVHATRGGAGRATTPGQSAEDVPSSFVAYDEFAPENFGFSDEDSLSQMYGYGVEDGTADRPVWGDEEMGRVMTPGYPAYGAYSEGLPGGVAIRTVEHGARLLNTAKVQPEESAIGQWVNKGHIDEPENAVTSDPSQYEMQTSMMQRDRTRAGSQAAEGRENEFDAPVRSRMVGPRLKFGLGSHWNHSSDRHADMEPKSQDYTIRPFWGRIAGTGYRAQMLTNELYVSEPLTRNAPPNPYTGPDVSPDDGQDAYPTLADGYTAEDSSYVY